MAEAQECCVICQETPATQGCGLDCCDHKMCMDCAVKVVIFSSEEKPRCPQCRREFETVTRRPASRFYRMKLSLTHATESQDFECCLDGFRARMGRTAARCSVGDSYLTRNQLKIASHIVVDKVEVDGTKWLKFYIPGSLRYPKPSMDMNIHDTDILTPPVGTQYAYDRPWYEGIINRAQHRLDRMTYNPAIPLFWKKALVSKTFWTLLGRGNSIGKYQMIPGGHNSQLAPGERILIMECKANPHRGV